MYQAIIIYSTKTVGKEQNYVETTVYGMKIDTTERFPLEYHIFGLRYHFKEKNLSCHCPLCSQQ